VIELISSSSEKQIQYDRKYDTDDRTGDNREVKRRMAPLKMQVAGKVSEPWDFWPERDPQAADHKQGTCDNHQFSKGIHT
jgi:hypothetical protein